MTNPSEDGMREKAKKIASQFSERDFRTMYDWRLRELIADALESFAKEAVNQAIDDIALGLREHEVSQRIRKEALEEAANVVEASLFESLGRTEPAEKWLANKIRSLISKAPERSDDGGQK